jgi:dihydrofolate synthase/folylpolyglutamate synthase
VRFPTVAAWLAWQQAAHPVEIDPGLERVGEAWRRLRVPWHAAVLTVGGTNGKGSVTAYLDSMLTDAGYETGLFTSPHLTRYNERIRVHGREATDAELLEAFATIDAARGGVSLTFFEWNALAAFLVFARARVDVAVLEVGMGGRLDAVNLLDADVAAVVSVGIDHREWLGGTVEAIGAEKAGIYRAGRPAIFGGRRPPRSLVAYAAAIGARLKRIGSDFDFVERGRLGLRGFRLAPARAAPARPGGHGAARQCGRGARSARGGGTAASGAGRSRAVRLGAHELARALPGVRGGA